MRVYVSFLSFGAAKFQVDVKKRIEDMGGGGGPDLNVQ